MIVACYHPLPLSACMLHFDLVSIPFGTSIPTSFNILVKMFLYFIMCCARHKIILYTESGCPLVPRHGVRAGFVKWSYRIQAIGNFDFAKPEEWPRWIRRFRQASDLVSKSEEVQISTLVYSMGDKVEDLLQSFNLEGDDAKKYLTAKEKFENYFVKRRNTTFERARFNKIKQESNETAGGRVRH